jgi:Lrp/AsnC family transcriptional regulator, leucine-responsive regulatory protein
MDTTDLTLVGELMKRGRASWAELAQKTGLSSPGIMDRIRRLEEKKIIRGYRAIIDHESLGFEITAFVSISLERPSHKAAFLKRIRQFSEIQECHAITGDFDYLLKIRCMNTKHFEQILSLGLKSMTGVSKTHSTIVMSTEKETSELALPVSSESETA